MSKILPVLKNSVIEIRGKHIEAAFNMEAMMIYEDLTGESAEECLEACGNSTFSYKQLSSIIFSCIKASGKYPELTLKEIQKNLRPEDAGKTIGHIFKLANESMPSADDIRVDLESDDNDKKK